MWRFSGMCRVVAVLSGTLLGGCLAPGAGSSLGPDTGPQLYVLGIAQDGGLPHLGCTLECCQDARRSGRRLYPASLGIVDPESGGRVLVEATPDVEAQVALLHSCSGLDPIPRQPVDGILLTHAHIGHYAGLVHCGREVASTSRVATYVSPRMAEFLRQNGPWSQLVALHQLSLQEVTPRAPFTVLPGVQVTAIPVPHRDEFSDTHAFKIRGPRRTVLFVPDIDRWTADLLEELLAGVDVAYLDATFYDGRELPGRDLSDIPHPPMVATMERLEERARATPGRLRFIHLNHTNPALHDPAIRAEILERGFRIAERGERIAL